MSRDIIRSVIWIFSCNGLFVLYYTVLRLENLIWNRVAFKQFGWPDIARAFLYGPRFDIAAVFTLSAIPALLALCPVPQQMRRRCQMLVAAIFFGLQMPFIVLNTVDMELINFVGRRATKDTLALVREVQGIFLSIVLSYWQGWIVNIVLLSSLFMAFLWLTRRRTRTEDFAGHPVRIVAGSGGWRSVLGKLGRAAGLGALVILLYAVAIRGGLQSKPITIAHAIIFPAHELNNLILNSSFTVLQSFQETAITALDYFRDRTEMISLLNGRIPGSSAQWTQDRRRRQNVVVLIMESFGQEYMGTINHVQGFTPFLDSLAARGLFFSNNYANGRRSIEAMPSILMGLPTLMSQSLISSQYANVRIDALGKTLGRRGYRTAFFHGGHNGTMYFDKFAKLAGFQEYYGFDEYPAAKQDDDGNWGVYDDPFLQFLKQVVSQYKEPFFVSFFSLTSHHPYPVPAAFKDRFPKGSLDIFESLGYADYALQHFFAEAEKQDWYKDTLFIITADHTHKPYLPEYANEAGRYRVPLIFFHPNIVWPPVDTSQVTQHLDIVHSVLDFLGIEEDASLYFGRSVFKSGERYATLFTGQDYFLLDREWNLRLRMPDHWALSESVKDPAFRIPRHKRREREKILRLRLLATLQYFQNGLLENNLLIPIADPGRRE